MFLVYLMFPLLLCCRYYYRRRRTTWVVLSVVFTIVMVVSAVTTLRYTATSDYTADDDFLYAPTDTRIIPVSSTFCQGLELSVDDFLGSYTASLSMLNSRPSLTGNETFSVHDDYISSNNDYSHYYYYMYPGSNFSLSVCISDGSGSGTFYLIKGHKNFERWVNNDYVSPTMDSFTIDASCSDTTNNTGSYHIQKEDYYYLVYKRYLDMQFDILMTFYRTRYEVTSNASISESCSVFASYGDSCSISVPLSSKTAFLVLSPLAGTEIDWTSGIDLDTTCVPRIWVYVLIAVSSFIGLVALVVLVPLVLICVVVKYKKKRNKDSVPAAVGVDSANAPLLVAPPTNPYLQQPMYGSNNYTAPPVYKP